MMVLSTIPRTKVRVYLQGLRLPLSALEAFTGHRGDKAWSPPLAFEGFEAGATVVVGSVLRDLRLVDEGRIQQDKLRELRRASALEVEAEQTRVGADAQAEARLDQVQQRLNQGDAQAEKLEEAAEARRAEARQEAQREQAQRAEAVARKAEARERRLARAERTTRLRSMQAESAALVRERRAAATVDKVAALDRAIEQKKARRNLS